MIGVDITDRGGEQGVCTWCTRAPRALPWGVQVSRSTVVALFFFFLRAPRKDVTRVIGSNWFTNCRGANWPMESRSIRSVASELFAQTMDRADESEAECLSRKSKDLCSAPTGWLWITAAEMGAIVSFDQFVNRCNGRRQLRFSSRDVTSKNDFSSLFSRVEKRKISDSPIHGSSLQNGNSAERRARKIEKRD